MYIYPAGTETHQQHSGCTKNLSGTHRGNLFCIKHQVRVALRDAIVRNGQITHTI